MEIGLTEKNKTDLIKLVKLTIANSLNIDSNIDTDELNFDDGIFREKFGAFVTLHKNGNLRGCIGYIEGIKPLKETIEDMAVSAAFSDPRFDPVSENEYDDIDVEISILTPITDVKNVDEIEVGKDGLIISHGFNRGLLLPQVATEQNWDRDTFLRHTCLKAGLPPDSWKNENVKIEKFSAFVFGEN